MRIVSIGDALASLSTLRRQKYNAGLWIEYLPSESTSLLRRLCSEQGIVHIDVLDDLLPLLLEDPAKPPGVFDADDLACWIEERSTTVSSELSTICTEVDSILATLSRGSARDFFKIASRLVLDRPMVIVTKLRALALASGFSDDRVWDLQKGGTP